MKRLRTWIMPDNHSLIQVLIVSSYDETIEDRFKGYREVLVFDPQCHYRPKVLLEQQAIESQDELFDEHNNTVNKYLKVVVQNG